MLRSVSRNLSSKTMCTLRSWEHHTSLSKRFVNSQTSSDSVPSSLVPVEVDALSLLSPMVGFEVVQKKKDADNFCFYQISMTTHSKSSLINLLKLDINHTSRQLVVVVSAFIRSWVIQHLRRRKISRWRLLRNHAIALPNGRRSKVVGFTYKAGSKFDAKYSFFRFLYHINSSNSSRTLSCVEVFVVERCHFAWLYKECSKVQGPRSGLVSIAEKASSPHYLCSMCLGLDRVNEIPTICPQITRPSGASPHALLYSVCSLRNMFWRTTSLPSNGEGL